MYQRGDNHPVRGQWFVAQVKPNQSELAKINLGRQGIDYFMPEMVRNLPTSIGRKSKRVALFPGYMFVSLDLSSSTWAKVRSTRGISRLVTFGSRMPFPLPTGFVEDLQSVAEQTGFIPTEPNVTEGSLVRVVRGPFADFIGEVQKLDDEQRAWLLLDFLGQKSRTCLGVANLELVRD